MPKNEKQPIETKIQTGNDTLHSVPERINDDSINLSDLLRQTSQLIESVDRRLQNLSNLCRANSGSLYGFAMSFIASILHSICNSVLKCMSWDMEKIYDEITNILAKFLFVKRQFLSHIVYEDHFQSLFDDDNNIAHDTLYEAGTQLPHQQPADIKAEIDLIDEEAKDRIPMHLKAKLSTKALLAKQERIINKLDEIHSDLTLLAADYIQASDTDLKSMAARAAHTAEVFEDNFKIIVDQIYETSKPELQRQLSTQRDPMQLWFDKMCSGYRHMYFRQLHLKP